MINLREKGAVAFSNKTKGIWYRLGTDTPNVDWWPTVFCIEALVVQRLYGVFVFAGMISAFHYRRIGRFVFSSAVLGLGWVQKNRWNCLGSVVCSQLLERGLGSPRRIEVFLRPNSPTSLVVHGQDSQEWTGHMKRAVPTTDGLVVLNLVPTKVISKLRRRKNGRVRYEWNSLLSLFVFTSSINLPHLIWVGSCGPL